jgi:hypothetical protein
LNISRLIRREFFLDLEAKIIRREFLGEKRREFLERKKTTLVFKVALITHAKKISADVIRGG